MLTADPRPRPPTRRSWTPALLAIAVSLTVHGSVLAGLLFLGQVAQPPAPYAVVGLVGAATTAVEGAVGDSVESAEDVPPSDASEAASEASIETMLEAAAADTAMPKPLPAVSPDEPVEATTAETTPAQPAESHAMAEIEPTPPVEEMLLEAKTLLIDSLSPKLTPSAAVEPQRRTAAVPPMPARKPAPTHAHTSPSATAELAQLAARSDAASLNASLTEGAAGSRGQSAGEAEGKQGAGAGSAPSFSGQGLSNAPPRYPRMARRQGQEGRVVVRVRVSAEGRAANVTVRRSSGYPLLDSAAVEAIETWRFIPASFGGIAVSGLVDVPVSFKLTDK